MPRRSKNDAANAADAIVENHVASRIRLRRALLGMSQSDLAKALGITFQQVQKYERGSNKVSIGKLYRLADILAVPLMFFFDGLAAREQTLADRLDDLEPSGVLSRRELDLLRCWRNASPEVADNALALLRAIGPNRTTETEPTVEPPQVFEPLAPIKTEDDVSVPQPRRRGRPPDSANRSKTAGEVTVKSAPSSSGDVKRRRRAGEIWNPADIRNYDK